MKELFEFAVLYNCLVYAADDNSWIYAAETPRL